MADDTMPAEWEGIAELLEREGLDGLLGIVVLVCKVKERQAQAAQEWEKAKRWHNRWFNCRAYKTMARRVEGRES